MATIHPPHGIEKKFVTARIVHGNQFQRFIERLASSGYHAADHGKPDLADRPGMTAVCAKFSGVGVFRIEYDCDAAKLSLVGDRHCPTSAKPGTSLNSPTRSNTRAPGVCRSELMGLTRT